MPSNAPKTSGKRPESNSRGQRRREALIRAGIDLLREEGWSSLTTRAVAERAESTPTLVQYHFGNQQALKRAVAEAAVNDAIGPALATLTAHEDWRAGVAALVDELAAAPIVESRLTAELFAAALRDPEVALIVSEVLAEARGRLSEWLGAVGAERTLGLATVIVAMLDGILVHRLIDPTLDLSDAASVIARGIAS